MILQMAEKGIIKPFSKSILKEISISLALYYSAWRQQPISVLIRSCLEYTSDCSFPDLSANSPHCPCAQVTSIRFLFKATMASVLSWCNPKEHRGMIFVINYLPMGWILGFHSHFSNLFIEITLQVCCDSFLRKAATGDDLSISYGKCQTMCFYSYVMYFVLHHFSSEAALLCLSTPC